MTDPHRLHVRDANIRKNLGWSPLAFIDPKFPAARTKAEKFARGIVGTRFAAQYQVHIYDVHRALEDAYEAGRAASGKVPT